MKTAKEQDHAREQAKAQLEGILELVTRLDTEDEHGRDAVVEAIQEDPLDVSVRSGWYPPGDTEGSKAEEYLILLCTGGPAVRIIGQLDEHGQPETAMLQYQDWFTSWTEYRLTGEQEETLLTYAQQFYFGE
ncbi:MAG: hypothetical protein MN733_18690 [Nitrososphaera sp.]|nr:hypothetical protein [Nitrososphaera sp.]